MILVRIFHFLSCLGHDKSSETLSCPQLCLPLATSAAQIYKYRFLCILWNTCPSSVVPFSLQVYTVNVTEMLYVVKTNS